MSNKICPWVSSRVVTTAAGVAILAMTAAAGPGCANTNSEADAIDAYIDGLPYLPADPKSPATPSGDASTELDGDYQCRTEKYSETGQYDQIVAYAANSESMWPGALVAGDSVYSGLFSQVVMARRPMTVSVSLANLDGAKAARVEAPSLSTMRDAVGRILEADVTGATPAQIDFQLDEVHSRDQLSIALDASVDWGTGSVEAGFDFNKEHVKSRYLLKFVQAYYTIDIDEPSTPSAVLSSTVTLADVESAFTTQNPPLMVSSVTYGRMVVFTLESEKSSTEIAAALSVAFNSGTQIGVDLTLAQKHALEESRIHAFVLGGSGDSAVQAVSGIEGIKQFIAEGGNYSKQSPGAPISYKLKHLKDNSSARMSVTTDYDVKICDRISDRYSVRLKSITVLDESDSGSGLELYGSASATGVGAAVTLWNLGAGQAVKLDEYDSYPATPSLTSFLGEAAINVVPQLGNNIVINVNLREKDGWSGDDNVKGTLTLPFGGASGWSGEFDVMASGGGNLVKAVVVLAPIL